MIYARDLRSMFNYNTCSGLGVVLIDFFLLFGNSGLPVSVSTGLNRVTKSSKSALAMGFPSMYICSGVVVGGTVEVVGRWESLEYKVIFFSSHNIRLQDIKKIGMKHHSVTFLRRIRGRW